MAIVAGMSARSVMLAVRRWTALWRLVGWSRMGAVYLVVVEVLHVLSMMPSLPPQLAGLARCPAGDQSPTRNDPRTLRGSF